MGLTPSLVSLTPMTLQIFLADKIDKGSLQYISGYVARKVCSNYHEEQESSLILFLVWIDNQGSRGRLLDLASESCWV